MPQPGLMALKCGAGVARLRPAEADETLISRNGAARRRARRVPSR